MDPNLFPFKKLTTGRMMDVRSFDPFFIVRVWFRRQQLQYSNCECLCDNFPSLPLHERVSPVCHLLTLPPPESRKQILQIHLNNPSHHVFMSTLFCESRLNFVFVVSLGIFYVSISKGKVPGTTAVSHIHKVYPHLKCIPPSSFAQARVESVPPWVELYYTANAT